MIYTKTAKVLTIFSVIVSCFIPFVFSSGCMFDPGTGASASDSDSTTYRVNGKVYTSDLKFLAGIHVTLFDSVNSIRSSVSITDTNGVYTITFPYIKQNYLFVDFFVPGTLSTLYKSKLDTIRFDDNYFKYGFTKYHETSLKSK